MQAIDVVLEAGRAGQGSTRWAFASAARCWPRRSRWTRARRSAGGQPDVADDDARFRRHRRDRPAGRRAERGDARGGDRHAVACCTASELALTFSSLRANDLIWPYVVNSYLKGKAPPAFDLLYWNADVDQPARADVLLVSAQHLPGEQAAEPGGTLQCGVPVDLGALDMPAYLYASREDHIVPWQTAYASTQCWGANDVRARRERPHRRRDQSGRPRTSATTG